MKLWLTALCVTAIAGIVAPPAHGQDVIPRHPAARIRMDVQMVSIPVAEAGRLVPAFLNRKTANDAWTRLQVMITKGEAKLIGWPVVWTQNGQRGVSESITEHRDPTQPPPPNYPQPIPAPQTPPWIGPTWGPWTPSAFETRNTGCTLEAEPIVEEDRKVISLNLTAQHVRRIATREWHTQADPAGVSGVQQQPEFRTSTITTSLDVRHDEPILIGTFVVAEPQPHVELFILHAKATKLPADAFPSPPAK